MNTEVKMHIYRDLWILCGFALGVLLGGIIELIFLNFGVIEFNIGYIYAPSMFAGVFFGVWAGPVAWRKIYVEGIRGKKYVIKK